MIYELISKIFQGESGGFVTVVDIFRAPTDRPEDRNRRIRRAMIAFMAIYGVFTVFQWAFFFVWQGPEVVNREAAFMSLVLSIGVLLLTGAFTVFNSTASRLSRRSTRIHRWSVHVYVSLLLVIWLGQLHLAGSVISPLLMLIPATAMLVSWMLGPKESWAYLLLGTGGLVVVFVLEKTELVPYFPLLTRNDELPIALFLDTKLAVIKLTVYTTFSCTVLFLLNRFQRDLEKRNEDLARLSEELEVLASTDSLTGLLNRRTVMAHLDRELNRCGRLKMSCVVVMADVDKLKGVNDTYGHDVGDVVLRDVSTVFKSNLRPYDLLARIGGEEFLIVITNAGVDEGVGWAERVRMALAEHVVRIPAGGTLTVTVSFGCTCFDPEHPRSINALLKSADEGLYEAKEGGRNRVVVREVG